MTTLCDSVTLFSEEVQTDDAILDSKAKSTVYEKIENTTRCRLIQMVSLHASAVRRVTQGVAKWPGALFGADESLADH